jgi:hypothetical protein
MIVSVYFWAYFEFYWFVVNKFRLFRLRFRLRNGNWLIVLYCRFRNFFVVNRLRFRTRFRTRFRSGWSRMEE